MLYKREGPTKQRLIYDNIMRRCVTGCVMLSVAVLGKNVWGPGPSSFGRQQRPSEITIEPIKNLGASARFGGLCPPGPSLKPSLQVVCFIPSFISHVIILLIFIIVNPNNLRPYFRPCYRPYTYSKMLAPPLAGLLQVSLTCGFSDHRVSCNCNYYFL